MARSLKRKVSAGAVRNNEETREAYGVNEDEEKHACVHKTTFLHLSLT